MIKFYALTALILATLYGVWRVVEVFDERDAALLAVKEAEATIVALSNQMVQFSELMAKDNINRAEALQSLEVARNERDKLQACIDAKSCGISIVVHTATPSVSTGTSAGDPPGTETRLELAPESRRAYFNHREQIDKAESLYKLCRSTLTDWQEYIKKGGGCGGIRL